MKNRAFSLLEVAVALAVISFAFVAILGLMPVAMNASLEAQRETRAAFIARGIFADIAAGKTEVSDTPAQPVFLNDSGTEVPTKENASFEATLERFVPNASTGFAVTRLPCIRLELSTPVEAPPDKRSKYTFVQTVRGGP